MTNTLDEKKSRTIGCLYVAIVLIVFFSGIVFVLRYEQQQSQRSRAIRRTNHRADVVSRVVAGDSSVVIDDLELLRLLAQNPKTTLKIERVVLTMLTINPRDALCAGHFKNLRHLEFYDCHGADYFLEACSDLPVEELYFEATVVSDAQIASLSNFQSLKNVRFEQVVDAKVAAALRLLPSSVEVEIPFPEVAETQE